MRPLTCLLAPSFLLFLTAFAIAPPAARAADLTVASLLAAPAVCDGIGDGTWNGCRGNGCAVCQEKLVGYGCYFDNHPDCVLNTTCAGLFFDCDAACPAPTAADRCSCDGIGDGTWNGCRGNGCAVCQEKLAGYDCYFDNHPDCVLNTTCAGLFFDCDAACPVPTEADRCTAGPPVLAGDTSCPWGAADCNPCASSVSASLSGLRDHGDILGFQMNGAADVWTWPIPGAHWQGVQRLMVGGGRYLAVSRSGQGVAFVVAEMASRNTSGTRWRSNRLHPSLFFHQTSPPWNDRILWQQANDPGFDHAGGVQAVGRVLAVPVEQSSSSRVLFYDLATPTLPALLYRLDHSDVPAPSDPGHAGAVGVTRLADGRYLVVVAGNESGSLDFYVSNTTSLLIPSTRFTRFSTQSGFSADFQSINLVNQCDGRIYLVGTHNDTDLPFVGADWVRWYELRNGAGSQVSITSVGAKHLYCGYPTGSFGSVRHCNFDAAAGAYVNPNHELYLYSTEHDNDGPGGSVKMEEFRPSRPSACPTINEAWVELYDDAGFSDRGLMIDYPDRFLENYENYDSAEGFEDKTSSAKWCIPLGWRYRLYEDKNGCGGSVRDLVGASEESNFDHIGFGDKVSCSRWFNF